MQVSDIDSLLWAAGAAGEVVLLGILTVRRVYRTFPIFFSWLAFIVLLEPTFYWLLHHASQTTYYRAFFALNFPQYLLEAGVLVEIAANVLQPVKSSLSRRLLVFLVGGMVLIGTVAFVIATHLNAPTLAHPRTFLVMNATMAILRLVTFLLIAGFSQLLGIGWRNHVLQLASGLAFYAAVTLIVEVAHSHLRAGPDYSNQFYALDRLRVAGYLCSLSYWCYSFARKEAPRKEFSPQMAQLLISISGSTKRQHSVVARSLDLKKR
jgi:hypothetical protein